MVGKGLLLYHSKGGRDQPVLPCNVSTGPNDPSGVSMLIITIFIGMPLSPVLRVPSTVQSGFVHECDSLRRPRLVELKSHDLRKGESRLLGLILKVHAYTYVHVLQKAVTENLQIGRTPTNRDTGSLYRSICSADSPNNLHWQTSFIP